MNKAQLTSMWIGIAVVAVMVFFPPWIGAKGSGPMVFIGHWLLYKQPTWKSPNPQTSKSYMTTPEGEKKVISARTYYPRNFYSQAQISYHLLYLQIFLVLLITVGSILTQADKKRNNEESRKTADPPNQIS
ncbi:MAG TPA: hypothetical protein P5279_04155 [Anaerohalosphaeraceae bacterium]|jgi:hypothetical protein|nr:hypothetical protein [Anaerohalosphaeraceae bacterium]HRT49663.1 hypothetical protein [Anaerohalosphaeraceae bacterium]HRT85980.1 hypothetical protein [Anaerohalosphaeraceae bacterium]